MDAGVAGFRFGGIACGIKKSGAADLAVIVADRDIPAYVAGLVDLPSVLLTTGGTATRVPVMLGRASVNLIEIRQGLQPGDTVILSDTSTWDQFDRLKVQ